MTKYAGNVNLPTGKKTSLAIPTGVQIARQRQARNALKGYFDRLESLNMVFDAELSINIILSGLLADYNQFVLSYQMNRKETLIMELHRLSKRKAEYEIAPASDPKEVVYFYYNTKGHWKHSCLKYLKDLKDEKVEKGSHSGSKGNHNGNAILIIGSSNELDKSKLWHSRLGHVNKKHIAQLQKDGVLESFDFKSDDAKASKECLDVVKSLMACKQNPGASICAFVLQMKGCFDRLESLNMVFDVELFINIILSGLPANYNQFVLSYQMDGKETSIIKLHSMLQTVKQGIKKIDVPSTSTALVLTVGHNAKKRKTSHSK
nr:hypothetical protein [Tanacetum cinerariifolium]